MTDNVLENVNIESEEVSAEPKITLEKGRYVEALGKRKTSIARVRLSQASKTSFTINGKDLEVYFPTAELVSIIHDSFAKVKAPSFAVTVLVRGGGIHSQAEAVRHGIARALVDLNILFRKKLKRAGYLKRDPRAKERRKFGLKKARKAAQWSKR